MLPFRRTTFICLLTLILLWCSATPSPAAQDETVSSVTVVLSRKIRPYLEALEGIESYFSESDSVELSTVFLPDFRDEDLGELAVRLLAEPADLLLSIGPEAARFIFSSPVHGSSLPVLYTMILNPEKIVGKDACTISLNIPIPVQLSQINAHLPEVSRVGLIYDPDLNGALARRASRAAADMDLEIFDLKVMDRKDITGVLNRSWSTIDLVWFVPDKTVISSSIVRYIIKEALVHQKPVVGYNRFFVQSGALMSFVFDYQEIGRQSAKLAQSVLSGSECRSEAPSFHVKINEKVVERLNLGEGSDGQ